jgi:hypothetical protein
VRQSVRLSFRPRYRFAENIGFATVVVAELNLKELISVVSRKYLYAAQAVILSGAKNLAAAILAAVMLFIGNLWEITRHKNAARDPSTPLADSLRSG